MLIDGIDSEKRKKIIGILLTLFPGAKIYLYGSRARGTHHDRSDIDLAIDAGKEKGPLYLGEARSILEATNIPYQIDLVDLNAISSDFFDIIKKERVLWN